MEHHFELNGGRHFLPVGGLNVALFSDELLDPQRGYDFLSRLLHPQGLKCPTGHDLAEAYVHKRDRAPILDYRCKTCGRCFNLFTNTLLKGTHYDPPQIIRLLRGIIRHTQTARLAREMGVNRKWLLQWRHRLEPLAQEALQLSAAGLGGASGSSSGSSVGPLLGRTPLAVS